MSFNFRNIALLALLASCLSCSKSIDFDFPQKDDRAFVDALFQTDSELEMLFGIAAPIQFATGPLTPSNALVQLQSNGQIDTLVAHYLYSTGDHLDSVFTYKSAIRLKPNQPYVLTIDYANERHVQYSGKVPALAPLEDLLYVDSIERIALRMLTPEEDDYFQFSLFQMEGNEKQYKLMSNGRTDMYIDMGVSQLFSAMPNTPALHFYWQSEGASVETLLFDQSRDTTIDRSRPLYLSIKHLDRHYFRSVISKGTQENLLDLLSEPNRLYGNLPDAYGVVAAASDTVLLLRP